MILSPASQTPVSAVLLAVSLLSVLAYGWVAVSTPKATSDHIQNPARPHGVLMLAWAAHLLALVLDIAGFGQAQAGARFGFAPALSMTVWLVIAVYMLESRFLPLAGVRRVLALLAALVVVLALLFPGESRPQAASPWAPIHWVLGLASYGLFGVAVLHAALLSRAERQMRQMKPGHGKPQEPRPEPLMPLLRLERLTFQFVGAGVAVLSLAVVLGWWFTPHWRWDHKNLFAVLGWVVLSGLLAGRRVFGWRGRRATRWLYFGALLLLLSYAGSRFVLEVVLQRSV
ncbi:cytochrome c biogenesis protein CcsA [Paucibacter sp. B2R-40]|uniref:cytochrome C assembly family protein n=1 Tax=Paucibacter sp. B2R-40 TaxID=2893554 RepID=UPI0021E3A635|nr:cytochrome c biogenesis protein CcsA [Paucibacter sp. B2R-40]MCV2354404.1 cytochrome c biogenesis protein CcsA [Paucibacter sp. B2R-40]